MKRVGRLIPLKKSVTECKQSQIMRKKKTTAVVAIAIKGKEKISGRNGSGFNKMRPWPLLFGRDEEACGLRDDAVAPTENLTWGMLEAKYNKMYAYFTFCEESKI